MKFRRTTAVIGLALSGALMLGACTSPEEPAGTTDPTTAAPGTIRGDFGRDWGGKVQQNLVHGSDSPESAARELAIWF